jgi:DNA-binding CsgD family transcriptional regulator
MTSTTDELLGEGRAALAAGDWAGARSAFSAALDHEDSAEALYGLARVVEWDGDYAAAVALYERAFSALRAVGESRLAALIAGRELSFLYAAVYGNDAAAGGWMARARSLALAAGDCIERGWVELADALLAEDPDTKDEHVGRASEIAQQYGDADLQFCAMGYAGLCLILRGRIVEGMRLVDEAAAAAVSGEVTDHLAAGEIYCKMLLCCELTQDVRRAQQWVSVAESLGRHPGSRWVSAICRMHYGGILTAAGRWAEANTELSISIEHYDGSFRALRSGAVVRLADLRVRQGRLDEAARLLADFEFDSYAVRPLARLHLLRGEVELAATTLRRFLSAGGEHVLHAPVLALLVEVEVAGGRFDEAAAVCRRLSAMAAGTALSHVRALAEFAAGVSSAATGDSAALAHFETALAAFVAAELPLEAARSRLAIARLLADSNPDVAVAEARAALETCQRLDAAPDTDAAASLLRSLGSPGRAAPRVVGPLTKRESEVLRLLAEGLSNDEIARRLFLSKRTVEHHVSNILAKLGLSTRAQALAYAARHGAS